MATTKAFNYYGTQLPQFEKGEVVLGALVAVKVMTESGEVVYREFKSPEIHSVEALGMLHTMTNTMERACMAGARHTE